MIPNVARRAIPTFVLTDDFRTRELVLQACRGDDHPRLIALENKGPRRNAYYILLALLRAASQTR